jgi:DNA-binding NarL/FixJ family response regulator
MNAVQSIVQNKRPILLVGDLREDAPLLRQALDDLGLDHCEIRPVAASEALSCLRGTTPERPSIVLLVVEGTSDEELSVLKSIKEDGQLRSLPVVVLGPSGDPGLVDKSFGLGAAGYMSHSADPRELAAVIRAVGRYWNLSELPKQA